MAGSTSFNLTREQEIGILALLIYLNTGAAWYFYISRKSEGYDDFEYGIIGSPPVSAIVVAPSSSTAARPTARREPPSSAPFRRAQCQVRAEAVGVYHRQRAPLLGWPCTLPVLHPAVQAVYLVGGEDSGVCLRGARKDMEERPVEGQERLGEGVGYRRPLFS
ncbi:hypothetical protein PG987_009537 [Apiospora arundinis]